MVGGARQHFASRVFSRNRDFVDRCCDLMTLLLGKHSCAAAFGPVTPSPTWEADGDEAQGRNAFPSRTPPSLRFLQEFVPELLNSRTTARAVCGPWPVARNPIPQLWETIGELHYQREHRPRRFTPRDGSESPEFPIEMGPAVVSVLTRCGTQADGDAMAEPEQRQSAGQRLGAQESLGISTLEHGHRPPAMPPGRRISVRVHMLDDTEEVFEVSCST
ncbi:hypothetical protein Z043_113463 [Scleropages formosus]|uniref:Uncharacterized protein n=1 Tax=Scleropages formosus TaxID=113540 RepID=A0A0N8JYZ3_SCLFO|nr:hypothetical protein Z043_113463 [Scleropages formosus]